MALNFPDHINISLFQASKISTAVLSQVTMIGISSLKFRTTENESLVTVLNLWCDHRIIQRQVYSSKCRLIIADTRVQA